MAGEEGEEASDSLEYTPTWVVAAVCFVIVLTSLFAERGLHRLGKCLKHKKQDALFEALQKLKEELMLLGFISLLLTVSQGALSRMCVPPYLTSKMLPCKRTHSLQQQEHTRRRHLLSENSQHCEKGKVPLMSLEALHHLHIFIFVLAVVHVLFCATTMVLGGARIRQWKRWEVWVRDQSKVEKVNAAAAKDSSSSHVGRHHHHHEFFKHYHEFLEQHAGGYWRKSAVVCWIISFFKQFYDSVTKSDYLALRQGFIMTHCPSNVRFDFHKYMVRTLEVDFKRVVSISWYLWLFVVLFLLINMEGWHSYFWLSFLPLALLLLVGAKLEHVIARLAQEIAEGQAQVKPSDSHFWFNRPGIVLDLIHFILFQNAFEIAFFFWILSTYGFHSCMMEKMGYIITRLIMGIIVQVLCSYSTLPLYALVTQMGSKFKKGMFDDFVQDSLNIWATAGRSGDAASSTSTSNRMTMMMMMPLADATTQVEEGDTRRTEIQTC